MSNRMGKNTLNHERTARNGSNEAVTKLREIIIEQRGNREKFVNELRANAEKMTDEPRAKQEKNSNEQLVARIKSGIDEADNMLALWQQDQGFIWKMAVKYSGHAEIEDLKQEAYFGLCKGRSSPYWKI